MTTCHLFVSCMIDEQETIFNLEANNHIFYPMTALDFIFSFMNLALAFTKKPSRSKKIEKNCFLEKILGEVFQTFLILFKYSTKESKMQTPSHALCGANVAHLPFNRNIRRRHDTFAQPVIWASSQYLVSPH